jgi:uncharacterized protein YjbJ (UPF0337 family)
MAELFFKGTVKRGEIISMIKRSTKNQVKGGARELAGKAQEKVGRASKRPDIQDKGTANKVAGKVQKKVGQVQRVFEK